MQHLHACLRRDSHLKYDGRLQYGLFLKDAGLSLDQAVAFWRGAFAQKVHCAVKKRGYFYSIRHYFGQEGSRKNYEAQSCAQITGGDGPLHGQNHGCPYTHMGESTLVATLKTLPVVEGGSRMSARDIETIVAYAKASNAAQACRHCFGATHGTQGGGGGCGDGGGSSAAYGGGGGGRNAEQRMVEQRMEGQSMAGQEAGQLEAAKRGLFHAPSLVWWVSTPTRTTRRVGSCSGGGDSGVVPEGVAAAAAAERGRIAAMIVAATAMVVAATRRFWSFWSKGYAACD